MRSEAKATLWVAIAVTVVLVGHVLVPFNFDNDLYQTIGFQLVHFHRLPYISSFDQNFPGIMYIHAGIIALFGNNEISFRSFETVLHIISAIVLFVLLRGWISDRAAALSVLLSCVYYDLGGVWFGGQRDGIAFFFVLISALLVYRIKDTPPNKLIRAKAFILVSAIGILAGIAIIIRPTNGLFALVLLIALWLIGGEHKYSFSAIYIFGILSVCVAAFAPYYGINGGLLRVYDCIIRFNTEVYTASNNDLTFIEMMKKPQEIFVDIVLVSSLIYLYINRKKYGLAISKGARSGNFDIFIIVGFYLSCRIPIIIMRKLLGYQFEVAATMSMVPIAIAIDSVFSRLRSRAVSQVGPVVLILALTIIVYPWHYVLNFFEGVSRHVDDPVTYSHIANPRTWFDTLLVDDHRVLQFLQAPGNTNGQIECQGFFSGLYWRSEREPSSAFTYIGPLAMTSPNGKTSLQRRWEQEFLDSLRVVKPAFLIISRSKYNTPLFYKLPPNEELALIPGFDSLLQSNYGHDTDIGSWIIYRAKH